MVLIIAIISVAVMTMDNKAFGQILTSGTLNGHEWVDLGLPSGTKWATCNVGASAPKRCGGYYEYEKEVIGDAGYEHWEGWQVPTEDQLHELRYKCKWIPASTGAKVVGPNGNSIFLPFAGASWKSYNDDGTYTWREPSSVMEYGYYWCIGYYLKINIKETSNYEEYIYDMYYSSENEKRRIKASLRLVVESD